MALSPNVTTSTSYKTALDDTSFPLGGETSTENDNSMPEFEDDGGDGNDSDDDDEVEVELQSLNAVDDDDCPVETTNATGDCPGGRRRQGSRNNKMKSRHPGWTLSRVPHVGLLMAVVSSLFFSLCSLIVRRLDSVSPLEHSTMRFVGVLLPAAALVVRSGENPLGVRGSRLVLLLRGVLGSAGLMFQFYAFQHMPLADASVLVFSSPVFVTVFARIFLGEACGATQVVSVVVTLVGVVLISRPPFLFGTPHGDVEVEGEGAVRGRHPDYSMEQLFGALSALCGTLCSANVYILIRKLKFLHYSVIMATFATIGIAMSQAASSLLLLRGGADDESSGMSSSSSRSLLCVPCAFVDRLQLLLLGLFSFFGQVLLTKALQTEQAGPVSICRTADIVFAFAWQVAFLGEVPDASSVVGALLVTLSVLVMAIRKWILDMPPGSCIRNTLWFLAI